MTRRQRHERIIENFGGLTGRVGRFHLQGVMARLGVAALTDAAAETLTAEIVSSHRRQQRYNREHRERLNRGAA